MSLTLTETQLIEEVTMTQVRNRFFLPRDNSEDDDQGLVMRLDSKLKEGPRLFRSTPLVPTTTTTLIRTPNGPAQLCGRQNQGVVAGWALLSSSSLLQTVPTTVAKQFYKLNAFVTRESPRVLPLLLYLSLFMLALQAGALIYLLARSIIPLGMWFLLTSGSVLGILFWRTTRVKVIRAQGGSPPPTPSTSTTSLASSTSS